MHTPSPSGKLKLLPLVAVSLCVVVLVGALWLTQNPSAPLDSDGTVAAVSAGYVEPERVQPRPTPTATATPEPTIVTPAGTTQAPEFRGIVRWLNSEPLALEEQRGKVVLIDFWTYS